MHSCFFGCEKLTITLPVLFGDGGDKPFSVLYNIS